MESKISCSLVFLPTAKLVWKQAMESKDSAQPPSYFLSPDMLSITFIRLNGSNYAQ